MIVYTLFKSLGVLRFFLCLERTFFCSPRLQLFEQKYSHVDKYHKLKQLFFYFNINVINSCDSKAEFLTEFRVKNKWKLIYSVINTRLKRTEFIWSVFLFIYLKSEWLVWNDRVKLWTRSQKFWHLLIYPPLMVIFSLSSTTLEEGWLDTTSSWLLPQTFLYAPLASKSFSLRQAIQERQSWQD